jgi:cyclic dehypoxanthinyl futalosine synthase
MTGPEVKTSRKRVNREQALDLLIREPMGSLMEQAHAARMSHHPREQVTFVFDTNPNYTNICVTRCRFCAFYRQAGDDQAYTLTPEQVAQKVYQASVLGATTVLLQGGHNPDIGLKDWLAYIRAIQEAAPDVHIHPFSPAEYLFMAQTEQCDVADVLKAVYDAGVRTIPGGGAEILTEGVRRQIAPRKADTDQWLAVCEAAHQIGFRTTATMMFGHVESNEDIVEHLLVLRRLQDKTGGFTSFIPWSYKPGDNPLGKQVTRSAHPAKYVRIIALARLVLDNFAHIQSSWFSENVAAGQMGLLAGADDFGGILVEENVHKEAGHTRSTTADTVKTIIRRAGFTPAQRDSFYNVLQTFEGPDIPGISSEVDPTSEQ